MQQHTLKITAQQEPTVLEKLLQATRYRGFNVQGMTMLSNVENTLINIELSVSSTKAIEKLTVQLNKLYDVNTVTVASTEKLQCHA
ncbi:MAG: acetolactate synthase 2 small subunit [Thalassotalea sp.]